MRLVHRAMGRAMGRWRDVAGEMKAQRQAMSGAVRRMLQRQLSMAWEQWEEFAAQSRAAQDERDRKRAGMKRAVAYMQNRKLAGGFNTWHEQAALGREQQKLLGFDVAITLHRDRGGHFGLGSGFFKANLIR